MGGQDWSLVVADLDGRYAIWIDMLAHISGYVLTKMCKCTMDIGKSFGLRDEIGLSPKSPAHWHFLVYS